MTADNPVRWEADGDVLVIIIDNPPVNALRLGVRAGIIAAVDALEADGALVAAIITGEGRAFIAGADITEFGKPPMDPNLNDAIYKKISIFVFVKIFKGHNSNFRFLVSYYLF